MRQFLERRATVRQWMLQMRSKRLSIREREIMRVLDIQVGKIYYDGKDSVREVIGISSPGGDVRYRRLAARQAQQWSSTEGKMISTVGSESCCRLESFAVWAKSAFDAEGGRLLLLDLRAREAKLSTGEFAFMRSAKEESGGEITTGTRIQVDHTEGRAVSGLSKKGFVIRDGSEAEVTDLGAAWFRVATQ